MKKILACMLSVVMLCALWVPAAAAPASDALLSYYGGDVNGDRTVNTSDVRALYASLSGERIALTSAATDVDGDGTTNMLDALTALQVSAGMMEPRLVVPPVTWVSTLPEGDAVSFETRLEDVFSSKWEEGSFCKLYVAQSLDELRAICDNDIENHPDYAALYDETFFEDKAVLVVGIDLPEHPLETVVSDVVHSGNTLTVKVRLVYRTGVMLPALWYERKVLEIPKEALDGVDTLQLRVSHEDVNGGDRVW